jgi:quercetin dioxygenase-like cupin family protein
MHVQRWHTDPVEQLSPTIGRQVVHTENMTIARITLGAGARVPQHDHVHEQVANVLEGRCRFVVGGDEQEVGAGESVFIASGVPHEVEALTDAVVLDVFSPVRDDWVRGEDAYLRGDGGGGGA